MTNPRPINASRSIDMYGIQLVKSYFVWRANKDNPTNTTVVIINAFTTALVSLKLVTTPTSQLSHRVNMLKNTRFQGYFRRSTIAPPMKANEPIALAIIDHWWFNAQLCQVGCEISTIERATVMASCEDSRRYTLMRKR